MRAIEVEGRRYDIFYICTRIPAPDHDWALSGLIYTQQSSVSNTPGFVGILCSTGALA